MRVFAVRIEHALDAAVQRSHDADARKHRRAARCRDQDQGLYCVLPFRLIRFGLRERCDEAGRKGRISFTEHR
jgi:hypothetical protein